MICPHCATTTTTDLTKRIQLGYRTFRCSTCRRQINERTGTPYSYLGFPKDIVLLMVLWGLRYRLRDLAEKFLERGFEFRHKAVRDWEARFAHLVADKLRAKRKGEAGRSCHTDETYIRVGGVWKYLYRAIDREGNLVDSMLSEHPDLGAAKRFFKAALEVAAQAPEKVTTDGHDSYPRAIRETLGEEVIHPWIRYVNNRIMQDHRGVKQRYSPMRGIGHFGAAARFCRAFDEQRHYFRVRRVMGQPLPHLSGQRREHCARWKALMSELMAA